MRVVLTSFGSTGDIFPMIALGKALLEKGHEATFATAPIYREAIEKAGLTFHRTPPDWPRQKFANFMANLDRTFHPLRQLRKIYRGALPMVPDLIAALDEVLGEADVLVASYMFPQFRVMADRHQIPFVTFAFCHNFIPTPRFPPAGVPALPATPRFVAKHWNQFWWRVADRVVDRAINGVFRPLIRSQQVPPLRGFLSRPAEMSIVSVSPLLGERRGINDPRFRFVGYLRWQSNDDAALEKEIATFCDGQKVPVLTFGSVAFDDAKELMRRFARRWPKGKKIIIQRGWANLEVEDPRPEIKLIDEVSHDQLFRHASCVIHHGGAGTTASVLHAGCPHVVVPHIADQHFFAREIRRLGLGTFVSKHRWPETLPRAISKVTRRRRYAIKAQRLAHFLQQEDGPSEAVKALEDYVADYPMPEETVVSV